MTTTDSRAGPASERAHQAAEDARRRAAQAGEEAYRQRARTGEAPRAYADEVREDEERHGRLHRAAGRTRQSMGRAGRSAGRRARDAGSTARHQAERARSGFSRMLEERPLVVGAIALAIGAALGALLPPTRREDEWLGETRDGLKDRAVSAGRAEIAKAERVAGRAMDTARDEAQREHLTPEGMREDLSGMGREAKQAAEAKLGETRDKARHVAEATRDAAKDEAKRQDFGSGRPPSP